MPKFAVEIEYVRSVMFLVEAENEMEAERDAEARLIFGYVAPETISPIEIADTIATELTPE